MAAPDDVVDDNAGIDLALVDVLAKHSLPMFLFGPVNLLGAQGVAHTKGHRDSTRAGTDNGNLRQATRDIAIEAEFSTQSNRQDTRRVVIAKCQGHLKIVW